MERIKSKKEFLFQGKRPTISSNIRRTENSKVFIAKKDAEIIFRVGLLWNDWKVVRHIIIPGIVLHSQLGSMRDIRDGRIPNWRPLLIILIKAKN